MSSRITQAESCAQHLARTLYGEEADLQLLSAHAQLVFRLRFPAHSKVLKLGEPAQPAPIAKEAALLGSLEGHGIPVPRVAHADPEGRLAGRPCLVLDDAGAQAVADLLNTGDASAAARYEEMGRVLRRVHGLHADLLPGGEHGGSGEIIAAEVRAVCAAAEHFARLGAVAPDDAAQLRDLHHLDAAGPVLCHGDFHAMQCVVDRERIAAVTDWNSAWAGPPWIDRSIARGYLDYYGRSDLWSPFVRGYRCAAEAASDEAHETAENSLLVRMALMVRLLHASSAQPAASVRAAAAGRRAAQLFHAYAEQRRNGLRRKAGRRPMTDS